MGNPKISIPLDWIARLVPTFHPATQSRYLLEPSLREHFRSAQRALLNSSDRYNGLSLDFAQLSDFCGELSNRNVNRTCDVAERAVEFRMGACVHEGHFFAAPQPTLQRRRFGKVSPLQPAHQPR